LTDIDVLIVESEDALSDFFIKWFRKHYTNFEERKEILGTKLWPLTSFPNFDINMFKHRSFSTDSDHVCVSKAVLEELLLKADAHERELSAATLTVMELEAPVRHCTTFWNITKENFQRLLFQVETCVYSLYFQFISTNFQLSAANVSISGDCEFGVSIWPIRDAERQLNPLQSVVITYEFVVRQEPSFEFEGLIP